MNTKKTSKSILINQKSPKSFYYLSVKVLDTFPISSYINYKYINCQPIINIYFFVEYYNTVSVHLFYGRWWDLETRFLVEGFFLLSVFKDTISSLNQDLGKETPVSTVNHSGLTQRHYIQRMTISTNFTIVMCVSGALRQQSPNYFDSKNLEFFKSNNFHFN